MRIAVKFVALKIMTESSRKLREVKLRQLFNKIELELTLETTQRDSRYSNTLVDLMRKEEVIIKDPHASAASRQIIQRVDEALKQETDVFFAKTTQQNIKRWKMLADKFHKEIQTVRSEVARSTYGVVGAANSKSGRGFPIRKFPTRAQGTPTADDIEVESERLEWEYNQHWYKYENFNLQEAFASQTARVENDWKQHEHTIADEFNAKRSKITGITTSPPQHSHSGDNSRDTRWQHPEKQKTLIHTAPVHSPNSPSLQQISADFGRGGLASRGSGGGANSRAMNAELERLDKEFSGILESLQNQKGDAKRWLHRQQVRLIAQVEQVRKERLVIADVLLDIGDLNNLVTDYNLYSSSS